MNRTATAPLDQAGAYAHLFDRVSAGGRFEDASSEGTIRLATDRELVEALTTAARLRRLIEAEETRLAGEIARRSDNPDTSLAKQMGASSAAHLVAQVTGVPRSAAGTMVASGQAFRTREAITGEPLPAAHPFVATAFADGLLDPEIAAAMRRALDKAAPGLAPWEQDELERQIVAFSQEGWAADELLAWLKQMPQHANPDAGKPNPDEAAPVETVTRKARPNGQFRWVLDLDAVTDGFLKTAIDANTTHNRPILHTPDQPEPDPGTEDRRPLEQRRVDGLRLLAKKALRVDDGQVGGTAVTLLVTMTEEALRTGLGTAELPDCGSQISASVARMIAADAEIIPVVLGGKSQPLDLGLGRRFFTEAQRRAMAVRDGGCAGPGCDAPPSWCDGAHIRPAGYGATSLDNGVLLCWRCHKLLDLHGWQIERIPAGGRGHHNPGSTRPDGDGPAGGYRLLHSRAEVRPCGWSRRSLALAPRPAGARGDFRARSPTGWASVGAGSLGG